MEKYRCFYIVALVLASACLSGCSASAGRYRSLREEAFRTWNVPAGRQEAARGPGLIWSGAHELSLPRALEVALERSPTLAAMRAAWQAAVERYPQVTALSDPRLGYGLAPSSIDSDSSVLGQKIEVSQHFPWPGKLALRGEVALSNAAAAGEDLEGSHRRLVRAVTEAFYGFRFVHRAIEINRTNQDVLAEFQRIAERRYGAGLASKNDVLQAEVARQRLIHRGIALERERAVAQARLNTLLDLPPASSLPPPPRDIAAPTPLPALGVLEGVALRQRPELQSLEHAIRARAAEARLARREFFPDLSVSAGYNGLWEDPDKRTLVGVALNLPLQVGRRRAALRQARAERRRAEARLEEMRAKVLLELSEAYDGLVEAGHVVHLYASSILPAARESLETARSGYATGANDFLTLLSTEKDLHLAELTYERALAEYHQGRARLEYAAGKTIEDAEEQE